MKTTTFISHLMGGGTVTYEQIEVPAADCQRNPRTGNPVSPVAGYEFQCGQMENGVHVYRFTRQIARENCRSKDSAMERVIRRPAVSFEQWAKANGVDIPPDHILADVIGGVLLAHPTRAARGKWRAKAAQLGAYQAAREAYWEAVKAGEIPMVEERAPLDMTKASDRAYARAMAKRAARAVSGS